MSKNQIARAVTVVLVTVLPTSTAMAQRAASAQRGKPGRPADKSPDGPPRKEPLKPTQEGMAGPIHMSAGRPTEDASATSILAPPASNLEVRPETTRKRNVEEPIPASMRRHRQSATKSRPSATSPEARNPSTQTPSGRTPGSPPGKRNGPAWAKIAKWINIQPSTTWYVGYEYHRQGNDTSNEFRITRGYVTLKFRPTAWFQPRITMDTHQDSTGDWKVRLKYLYAKFVVPWESRIITNPSLEVGLVHNPWFDYEEHINRYRAEGPMFIERNGILNSADVGMTFGVLLGRPLGRDYRRKVSSHYPGAFGSIQMGLYNGAGYHAIEANSNKVFMTRESIRPLGSWFPYVQLTHFFIFGRSNTPTQVCDDGGTCIPGQPRWLLNLFMASVEQEYFTLTGQYAVGKGNQKGDKVDSTGSPLSFQGYSVFAEIKLPWIRSSIMGRFDWFGWKDDRETTRVLAGVAYHFFAHNFLLVSLDRASFSNPKEKPDWRLKTTIQIHL